MSTFVEDLHARQTQVSIVITDELTSLPRTLGRYKLVSLLGRGGMGRVVLGHDPKLKRDVALKLVEPLAIDPEDLNELRFMFHREARAIAKLHHPGIVEIYDYSGPEAALPFIACELVEAPTLADVIRSSEGPLTGRLSCAVGYELCDAIGHAHSAGILHRDLKTDNVFWCDSGRIVLADFGIAKAFGSSSAKLGATIEFGRTNLYGSPATMAPEQLDGGDVGPHTDLYAFGAILFECITGQPAFRGRDLKDLVNNVTAGRRTLAEPPAGTPSSLFRLVEELLERDIERRPKNARSVLARLRGILDELHVGDPRLWLVDFGARDHDDHDEDLGAEAQTELLNHTGRTVRIDRLAPSSRPSRRPLFLAAAISIVLGLALGALLFLRQPEGSTTSDGHVTAPQHADLFVHFQFPGRAEIEVDGVSMGSFDREIRIGMKPGRYAITVRSALGAIKRTIVVKPDTHPKWVFDAGDFQRNPR